MDLSIEQDIYGHWCVLDVKGTLDADSVSVVRDRLAAVLRLFSRVALRLDHAVLPDQAHLVLVAAAQQLAVQRDAFFAVIAADEVIAARLRALSPTAPPWVFRSLYDLYGPRPIRIHADEKTWGLVAGDLQG